MEKEVKKCCICGCEFTGWGNNPYPISENLDDTCCDECNSMYVIPARIVDYYSRNRIVGYEEIIYEKLVKLNEELKRMNERLDEILGDTE